MSYLGMGLAFAAIGFVVANAALSLLAGLLWRAFRGSRRPARQLFVMRMLPAMGSAGLVLGLVLPAFWSFEPSATSETAGPALWMFVALAGLLVAAGMFRAAVSWRKTRRLTRTWEALAFKTAGLAIPVAAFRVSSDMPLAALVGVVRPRLFVSGQFMDALSANERQAVLDHEAGHLRSRDNLKRTVMKLAPDWLSFAPAGRELEAAWAAAAEEEADDHAAGSARAGSLDLAGALLKASRMMPMPQALSSNFCDESSVSRRIARLLDDAPGPRVVRRSGATTFALVLALLGAIGLLAGPGLPAAYAMTEAAVRLLQ